MGTSGLAGDPDRGDGERAAHEHDTRQRGEADRL